MVNEVNKLIFNTLVEGGAIYIADRGTISIERTSARAMRRGRVVSPTYELSFSTECNAQSLSSIIASVANISAEDADDIARRWLDKVTADDRIVIEGVGTIANGSFTADKALVETLAASNKALTLTRKKKSRRWPWILLIFILIICACAAAYLFLGDKLFNNNVVAEDTQIEIAQPDEVVEQTDPTILINTLVEPIETTEIKVDSVTHKKVTESIPAPEVVQEPKAESVPVQEVAQTEVDLSDWRNLPVHHYVIFGSYSTATNANNAIRKIMRRNPAAQCKVIRLGGMHAVAVYGSYNRSECEQFKRQYRSIYKDAWVHTPKRFK